jgi:hypothetical protein
MKVLSRLWQRIRALFQHEAKQAGVKADTQIYSAEAKLRDLEQLLRTKGDQHLADLRVLLDHAHDRERELSAMVKMVVEERFYRPVVTGARKAEASVAALPAEVLNDVTTFDEEADAAVRTKEHQVMQELEHGFEQVLHEENEFRASRGKDVV